MTFTSTNRESSHQAYKETFQSLKVDDQLALLWHLYVKMGGSTRPANPEDTAPDSGEGLFNKVKEKFHQEQLQVMRDLLGGASTDITQEYHSLSNNTKLAFWYELARGMEESTIVQVPSDHQLSSEAQELISAVGALGFEDQYIFLRNSLLSDGA